VTERVVQDLTFKSGWTWLDLGTQIQLELDIQILVKLVFGSENNMPDETYDVNNADSCCKGAAHFSASFVTSLFGSF